MPGPPPDIVRVSPADAGATDPVTVATVAEAVSAVAPSGTILIADGTHVVQDVQVNKPITIEAEGPGAVLDGTGGVRGFDVGGSPGITSGAGAVTIRGLSFQNMFETGIHVTGNYDLMVVENSVFFPSTNGLSSGVFVSGANGNGITIQDNTFTGGAVGVHVGTTPGVLVLSNGFDNQGTNPVRGPIELMQGNTITRCHGQCVEVAGFAGSSLTVIDNSWTVDISDPIVAALNIDEGALADAVVIEDNSVIGIGGTHDPSIAETFPMHFAGININTGSVELSRNTVQGAFHAIVFNNVGTVTASDNTIDGVNVAWQAFGSVGSGFIHSNDITNFGVPFQGPGFTPGSLTCNWWGSVFGPDPGPGPDPDIFTPWATAPIANSAGGLCDGMPGPPPDAVRVDPAIADTDPDIVATLQEAIALVAPGGTITVADGLHAAPGVRIEKPMTITADPNTIPIMDGQGNCFVFEINGIAAGLVAVNSLHFINAGCSIAVAIEQQYDQVTVENSEFDGLGIAVNEQFVAGATVTIGNNQFFGAGAGVSVQNAANVTILDNLLEGTGSINVGGTSQATLERNTFTSCGGGPACIIVGGQPSGSVTVRDNQLTVDISQQIPSGMLVNLGNHIITGNTIVGTGQDNAFGADDFRHYPITLAGIEVVDGAVAAVSANSIENAFIGLQFGFDVTVTGTDNDVNNVATGVQAFPSGDLTITGSDFTAYGVSLELGVGAPKDFTCNWWGFDTGPVAPNVPDASVYTPWATAPIANGAGGLCDGMP